MQPDRRAGAGALPKRDTGMDRGTACDVHQWTVSGEVAEGWVTLVHRVLALLHVKGVCVMLTLVLVRIQ